MTCEQPQYALAAGYDNPDNLLVLTDYTVAGDDIPFQAPMGWGFYNAGVIIPLPTFNTAFDGFASVQWVFSYMTYNQLQYLRDTYCAGGWSGSVTAALTTDTPNQIEYWNCAMRIPQIAQDRLLRPGYSDLTITFVLDEQITYGELLLQTGFNLLLQTGGNLALQG